MKRHLTRLLNTVCIVSGLSLGLPAVRADVTIDQKTTLEVASMIKTHGASTTNMTADKKREDTESHCEGIMSMVCGNVHGGESRGALQLVFRIVRYSNWGLI